MNQLSDPIAVFDSGMGGISVLREMTKLMPNEDFIYYGDSKHAPYGTKTLEEVRTLTIEHITYLIKEKHAKAVAVACNTATSAAVRILRDMYPDPTFSWCRTSYQTSSISHRTCKSCCHGYTDDITRREISQIRKSLR